VRRSRALHSVFRDELSGSELKALKPGFQWLGKITGPTRDLDVHLIGLLGQKEVMPVDAEALLPLLALLRERRREERAKLLAELDSPRYAEFMAGARELLESPESEAAVRIAGAGPSLESWASPRIAKAHRRLLKHGRSIDRSSPDAALHQLRIDGKKLRYLLEFFHSLYAEDEIEMLVKELKRLQDNLGSFHDACVQARVLRELARDLGRLSSSYLETLVPLVETLLSVGRLVERAEASKAAERTAFEKRFARFDAPKTHGRFRRLFGSGKIPGQHAVHQTPGDVQRGRGGDEAGASARMPLAGEQL
jgi:CHAD domain-containing protein